MSLTWGNWCAIDDAQTPMRLSVTLLATICIRNKSIVEIKNWIWIKRSWKKEFGEKEFRFKKTLDYKELKKTFLVEKIFRILNIKSFQFVIFKFFMDMLSMDTLSMENTSFTKYNTFIKCNKNDRQVIVSMNVMNEVKKIYVWI